MDLNPLPDHVLSAAGNVAHLVRRGGMADLRPMPRAEVARGERHRVHHLEPDPAVAGLGGPVLLVPPLAVPDACFDLRRGCSLAEHLVAAGRPAYVVELDPVDFRDPDLALDPWVTEVLPAAIREASRHAGGQPVHVVGWSLGGTFALLAAAREPGLPVASLTVLGTPVDVSSVPMLAPLRPLISPTDWSGPVGLAARLAGSAPGVRWALGLPGVQQLVTRPAAVAAHLDDADWLAQLEAVDRLSTATAPYRGRAFGRLHHRFARDNALASGTVELADGEVSLSAVTAPTLVVAGADDTIVPVAAVRPAVAMLTGAREVRFEIVPGGHLGLLTGRGARTGTWPVLDEWLAQWDGRAVPRKRAAKKAPAKKAPAKKAPAKRAAAKKSPAKKAAPSPEVIGANPRRRHSSAGSRALAP
ncbi:alpha/beta fold hydrolase [Nocardioides conyzicola]|uniref:Alpha/beta hydrolase n=1 Tax=Nocardioides conyzicola TaxID=1651781 RepID=A0ABP8XLI5_9ACTN